MMMHHLRVREYSRKQTQGESDFTPKKCARKNTSREWCDGGVASDVSHFSYLRYVLERFSDATNETSGRVLDARERFRAFRRRKKILPQEGSVCASLGKSSSLSHPSRSLIRSLSASRASTFCVCSGLFSQQRRTATKRVCVHPFTIR